MADIKSHSTLPTSLVSYWDLEEASGTRYDLVGSNDLTDNNTVTQATGTIGNGAKFDGSTEYLSITDASQTGLDITGDISISAWVNFDVATGEQSIVSKHKYSTGDRSYWLYVDHGASLLKFVVSSDGGTTNRDTYTVTWNPSATTDYHVAVTWDASASTCKFYVDGSQQGADQVGSETAIYNGSAIFAIGVEGHPVNYFDGLIDEVGIWSKVLTSSEITDLYNSGSGLPYYAPASVSDDTDLSTSLTSYWEMEEATAATRTDSHGSNDLTNNSGGSGVTQATGITDNGADFDTASSEFLSTTTDLTSGTTDRTMAFWVKIGTAPSSGTTYALFTDYQNVGNNRAWAMTYRNNGGTLEFYTITSNDGSSTSTGSISQTLTAGTWYHLAFAYDKSAGSIAVHVDGVLAGTISSQKTTIYNGSDPFRIGALGDSGTTAWHFDGVIDEFGQWDKLLSEGEIRALYGYGTPPAYSSGTDYPLTAALGTFTLTGIATTFNLGWGMVASVGSFTLSGIAATFALGKGMVADVGSFALTGISSTMRVTLTMAAAVGSFTLTGIAAALNHTKLLIASAASFVLTGISTTLKSSNIWRNRSKNSATWTNRDKS